MRFTDLRRSLATITPKGLTSRLRELERDGVVERESVPGRREVWYRLTEKGRALDTVIGALAVWGFQHAISAPRPDEEINLELGVWCIASLLQFRGTTFDEPLGWRLEFDGGEVFHITFADGLWAAGRGHVPADVVVSSTPRQWATAVALGIEGLPENNRPEIRGAAHQVERFRRLFEVYRQAQ